MKLRNLATSILQSILTLLGSTSDDESDNTVMGKLYILDKHIHSPMLTKPYLADGFVLTGHDDPWTLGDKVQLLAANEVTVPYDVHFLNVESVNVNDTFQVQFWTGAEGAEVKAGTTRVGKDAVVSRTINKPMLTFKLPANTRLSASIASSSGGEDTLTMSIEYHEY